MQNTLAAISLRTIVRNAQLVQNRAGVPLIAVVKDDAYGHGAERVAAALEPIVQGFAVATVEEGAALRISGVRKKILVLTPCLDEEEVLICNAYQLLPTISSFSALHLAISAAKRFSLPLCAQLKINTGMNRYGFRPEQVDRACANMTSAGGEFAGIFSHFYAPEDECARESQYEIFSSASERALRFFPRAQRHLSSTGGILAGKKYNFDAVRSGIALYGYLPHGFEGALDLKPAMKLYAATAWNGTFLGGGVCYRKAGAPYRKLTTLRFGYGDGLPRAGGVKNVNELCMDAFVREGYAPFGKRRLVLSDMAAFAKSQGTIVYEVLVNIAKKAEKIYV